MYVDETFYLRTYRRSITPRLPVREFEFWTDKAQGFIDHFTFNRIDGSTLEEFKHEIGMCVCELAEYLYLNEGNEHLQSESVPGRSATYIKGAEYKICQRHLRMTGLMYRGSA